MNGQILTESCIKSQAILHDTELWVIASHYRKIAETRSEVEVTINADGSIYARIPSAWVKINPGVEMTEEKKEIQRQRMIELRKQGKL